MDGATFRVSSSQIMWECLFLLFQIMKKCSYCPGTHTVHTLSCFSNILERGKKHTFKLADSNTHMLTYTHVGVCAEIHKTFT